MTHDESLLPPSNSDDHCGAGQSESQMSIGGPAFDDGVEGKRLKKWLQSNFQLFIKKKSHIILNPKLLHIGTGDYDFSVIKNVQMSFECNQK